MAQTGSKIKSDVLTGTELILCAIAAILLHMLLVLLFSKEENVAPPPVDQNRSNILFAESDLNFKAISQRINAEPDPSEFIRGGKTGYSSINYSAPCPKPEFKNEAAGIKTEQVNSEITPHSIRVERNYSDLLSYAAPVISKNKTDPAQTAPLKSKITYPIWKDAHGVLANMGDTFDSYTTIINSNTAVAPTILKIRFQQKSKKDLPVYVTIHQSCGNIYLDQHAKKLLQNRISDPAFLKNFNPESNDAVFIFWQAESKTIEQNSIPENMFPQEAP